ncbi:Flap-structured DNA-binding and RNA-binding protein [Rhizina undulata]
MSNRNSTPDQSTLTGTASLRPPTSRPLGSGHHLRASADMSGAFQSHFTRTRPSSEIFLNPPQVTQQNAETEALDKAAREWINDLETYENTLEEMASAALDQDFKDELSAIEQWFRVLSEAERTAALYALLQQTTQVQIRFFIQVLQQMARSHPMSNILSPNTFEKDAMASRMNDAMSKLNLSSTRESFNRPPPSPGAPNRNSGVDATVQAMFPDAAAAIAAQRALMSGQGGSSGTKSNRNSALFESRPSSLTPNPAISTQGNTSKENNPPPSPWARSNDSNDNQNTRPKSAAGMGSTMGNFQLPPPSAGLRSPRNPPPQITGNANIQTTTLSAPISNGLELPQLSPYGDASSGNWASMVNTPVAPIFPQSANADMVANATAMKLAALSTVNNRIILDSDPKGWNKRRQKETSPNIGSARNNMQLPVLSPANITMYNEHGQLVQIPATTAAAALQAASQNGSPLLGVRSRPNSPGIFQPAPGQWGGLGFTSPQAGGFLTAQSPLLSNGLLGQFGNLAAAAAEGYNSDDVNNQNRGRSPRGRRGSSKPPEDPTDPSLLQDISVWLRSLRLHKYTDNLKDLDWKELITLDDEALEKRGVNALGARRKMLKVFEQVREAQADGKLPDQ